jgi:hypothetical protein
MGTLLGLTLVACALWALRRRPHLVIVAFPWLALPVVMLWLVQPVHFIAGRHLAFTLPILLLLLGLGVATLAEAVARAVRTRGARPDMVPRLSAALTAALVIAAWGTPSAEGLRSYYQGRVGADWRTVASVLDRVVTDGDRVLATVGAVYPLRHYWAPSVEDLTTVGFPAAPSRRVGRAWVIAHEGPDRPLGLVEWLDVHAIKVGEIPASWSLPGLQIYRLRTAS